MTEYIDVLDYGERGAVHVVADAAELAAAAAEALIASVASAIAARGRAVIALSGGSTPKRMGELLTRNEYRNRIDWARLHVFWGDERWVPLDDPDCNAGEAIRTFLDGVGIPASQLHPWRTDLPEPDDAARDYVDQLRAAFGPEHPPRFDLVLLGLGDDGHTASLFPTTDAINEKEDHAVAHRVEKLDAVRLTVTPPVLNAGREVVVLVAGSGKAHMLHRVLDGDINIDLYPAQVIRPASGTLRWLVDVAAAELLERRVAADD